MTFRQDSEFYTPYGKIRQTSELPTNLDEHIVNFGEENIEAEYLKDKNMTIAWFVSNCDTPSHRMDYVKVLKKHIQVDIYGKCGHLKCSRSQENECWNKVDKHYHFYLAFENSICKDYVTEKFFNAMNHNVVPIVLGGANYQDLAPKNSYIDAYNDYKNPVLLAKYLKNLIDDKAAYAQYFWWKPYYSVGETDPKSIAKYQCKVCEQLNSDRFGISIYEDLTDWWIRKSRCKQYHLPRGD